MTTKKPVKKPSKKKASLGLDEYERKRDFSKTKEPAPSKAAPATSGAPSWLIHKHHARALHYDLRLEMDGALASWAVPKGPSLDPAVKRLAVQTEDHPLEYGEFEGRIPDDEYGGGDSLIWDRGTYETDPPGAASAQRKAGHLRFTLHGEKLHGAWHLIRTKPTKADKPQWLLWKAKDEHASKSVDIVAERPESVVSGRAVTRGPETKKALATVRARPEALLEKVFPPMLATLSTPPEGDWQLEVKYDGFRALAALSSHRVIIWSRNQLDLTPRFASVAKALQEIVVGDAVIDGEICALDEHGASRFQLLQGGAKNLLFFAFDLLWLDGEDLRGRPLEERRELLTSLLGNAPGAIQLSELVPGPARAALAQAASRGLEGVIAKRRGSFYEAGRSKAWLKVKALQSQETAIIGWLPLAGAPHAVGSLLVAVMDRGNLVFAGKVGTGFTSKQRGELYQALVKDRVERAPAIGVTGVKGATFVEPKLVGQIAFTEWTADGKMRHPSFQGLRADKTPKDCVRELPVPATETEPAVAPAPAPAKRTHEIEITLTNPDKLLYPDDAITKAMVADYYEAVTDPALHALADRPLAFERWPAGILSKSWYQQNVGAEGKAWMTFVETPSRGKTGHVRHLIADRPEIMRWFAQFNVLTIHMWHSRAQTLLEPDWVVFDFDPAEGRAIEQAIEPAHALRRLCEELKLPTVCKTSGKRGLHVLVPLAAGHTHEQTLAFAEKIGDSLCSALPGITMERAKAARKGRLYLDCMQNGYGKLIVAPYSLRAARGAPVSTPVTWDEITPKIDPAQWNLRTLPTRLAKVGDLFAPALTAGVKLPKLT